ncbi:sigma-70 family RNA polymerase sigma factor [Limibacter armeniacum]|uniref:RNA polymerase sigma factor n=1 Tax=Limibacter armeniacum TaxID=466084 RepID=UPI002FE67A3F
MHQTEEDIKQEMAIIEKARHQPEAFRFLYEKYYKAIFLFVFKRVGTEDMAAEVTSQVFLKAMDNLPKYEFRGVPFSAWLFRIAANQVNDHFRKSTTDRVVSLESGIINTLVDEDDSEMPETDEMELLGQLLNELNESEISLLELRYFEKRSVKDVAYMLDISEANVKVKTHRVIGKLKKLAKRYL